MNRTRISSALLLVALLAIESNAQTLQSSRPDSNSATNVPPVRTRRSFCSPGTALQIALDGEVRVRKVGQFAIFEVNRKTAEDATAPASRPSQLASLHHSLYTRVLSDSVRIAV
jgi:hypothetical protein